MKKISLTKEEVLHLASLANLQVTEQEVDKFKAQLSETITYAENLHELNTDHVKEAASSIDMDNIFFEDGSQNDRQFTQEEALKNSSNKKGEYFTVKKIM